MSAARLRCGLIGLVLLCSAKTVAAGERFETFATVAVVGASGSYLHPPGNFAAQVGVGHELKRSTSLELMAGYHWLGDVYYSYSGFEPNIDSHIRLIPITLNLTWLFRTQALPHPYATFGTGYYAIHYDRIKSEVPNQRYSAVGLNVGVGFKGSPGAFSPRIDARGHFVFLPERIRYPFSPDSGPMRLWTLGVGLQFP